MMRSSSSNGAPEMDDPLELFQELFSVKKPKDAKAGLASGLKSAGKGVGIGLVGLVGAPIVGAFQQGAVGFAKGLGIGVINAAVMPVVGVAVCGTQIVRGIANTPEAIASKRQGKEWNQDVRQWIDFSQKEIVVDTAATRDARSKYNEKMARKRARQAFRAGHADGGGSGEEDEDEGPDFYELLGVDKDASDAQIKKQYYTLARKLHPDKNPNDEEAKERFQAVGRAYQVLSDPELRSKYDTQGSKGLKDDFMDPSEFFSMLFGSDQLEPLIGELRISLISSKGELNSKQMAEKQKNREAMLCKVLKQHLEVWETDEAGFRTVMQFKAQTWSQASFGPEILHAVASAYDTQAQAHSGNLLSSITGKLKTQKQNVSSTFKMGKAVMNMVQEQGRMEKEMRAFEAAASAGENGGKGKAPEGAGGDEVGSSSGSGGEERVGGVEGQSGEGESSTQSGRDGGAGVREQSPGGAAGGQGREGGGGEGGSGMGAGADEFDLDYENMSEEELFKKYKEQYQGHNPMEEEIRRAKLEEQALPVYLEAMKAANLLDIQDTCSRVCRMVLSNPKSKMAIRARGLAELASILEEEACAAEAGADGEVAAKQRMERAMEALAAKKREEMEKEWRE